MSELSTWLKKKVADDGRSVRKIAEAMDVDHQNLGNWLAGKRPSWLHCNVIADYYGVSDSSIRRMAGYVSASELDPIREASLTPEEETIVRAYRLGDDEVRRFLLSGAQVALRSGTETGAGAPEEQSSPEEDQERPAR